MANKNSRNSTFFTGTISKVSSTHRVQTLLKITLRVFEINDIFNFRQSSRWQPKSCSQDNAFLHFTQKFKMAAKNSNKAIFVKCRQYTRQIPCGLIFHKNYSISNGFPDKCVVRFMQKFKMATKKCQESDFCKMSPVHSVDTLRIHNFVIIALSHTVSEINVLLCFTQKFKMADKSGRKAIFCIKSPADCADTLWVQNFIEIALCRTVSKINALLRFT